MNNLKVAATTSTSISWRDEISPSQDVESEGLKELKEAIKLAKSSNSVPEFSTSGATTQTDACVKAVASGT